MDSKDFFVVRATAILKLLADETRLNILMELMEASKRSGELAEKLKMSRSAISHQLRILKANNLVVSKRDGRNKIYKLSDKHVQYLLQMLKEHIMEDYHARS